MAARHPYFNKGVVWAYVHEPAFRTSRKNKRPYAHLKLVCDSRKYGKVVVFGRLWGEKNVEDFRELYAEDPARLFRFQGNFTQLRDRERVLLGYNFTMLNPTVEPEDGPRAAFILKGDLVTKSFPDDEYVDLTIRVDHNGKAEEFGISVPIDMARAKAGDKLHVSGHLRDMDAAFGSSGMDVRAVAERFRKET
jgi:hypothetical protein